MDQQQREARNSSLRRIGRARAEARTCPACERKNALRSVGLPGLDIIKVCRWCGYERGRAF